MLLKILVVSGILLHSTTTLYFPCVTLTLKVCGLFAYPCDDNTLIPLIIRLASLSAWNVISYCPLSGKLTPFHEYVLTPLISGLSALSGGKSGETEWLFINSPHLLSLYANSGGPS